MRSAPKHEFANVRGDEQVLSEEAKGYGLDSLHIAKLEPRERAAELLVTNRPEPFRSFRKFAEASWALLNFDLAG
jgi:hypothetical protein